MVGPIGLFHRCFFHFFYRSFFPDDLMMMIIEFQMVEMSEEWMRERRDRIRDYLGLGRNRLLCPRFFCGKDDGSSVRGIFLIAH